MNKEQAKQAMREGKRLTHASFTDEEWVQGVGSMYQFEDGCLCYPYQFWQTRTEYWWDTDWQLTEVQPTEDEEAQQ